MTKKKNLSLIGIGAASVAAVTIGAAGIASAQEDDPVLVDPPVESENAPAETGEERREGRRGDRQADRQARIDAMVADLVEQGVITEEQVADAQAVREALQAEREAARAEKAQELADVLGITVEELQAAKEEGTTIAELAGDDLDAVVDLFVDRMTERIEAGVESGRITQEQADEKLDGLEERVTTRLEEGGGFGRRGEDGHRGRRGFGPRGDNASAQAEEAVFSA